MVTSSDTSYAHFDVDNANNYYAVYQLSSNNEIYYASNESGSWEQQVIYDKPVNMDIAVSSSGVTAIAYNHATDGAFLLIDNAMFPAVPEPATVILMLIAVAGLIKRRIS